MTRPDTLYYPYSAAGTLRRHPLIPDWQSFQKLCIGAGKPGVTIGHLLAITCPAIPNMIVQRAWFGVHVNSRQVVCPEVD